MQATAADYTPTQTQAPAVACVPVKQKKDIVSTVFYGIIGTKFGGQEHLSCEKKTQES